MKRNTAHSDAGMAMVMALMFVSVSVIVLTALTARLMNQRTAVDHYEDYKNCFQGMEAAIASGTTEVENGDDGTVGLSGWTPTYDANNQIILPAFDDGAAQPLTFTSMPGLQFMAYTVNWFTDNRDNNGDGLVDDSSERHMYGIYALAKQGSVLRRAEVIAKGGDVNVWRNAIFAGNGQAGGLVNGNVSIHGAVHLLGQNLLEGNTAITALDLSGTSLIHNNYGGIPATLAARVPPLPQTVFNGETVSTLEAKLRVKRGLVSLSGNSEVGEPDVAGNTLKETMDGVHVNDGWTGNAVVDDGDRGDPKSVFSDNGWDELYDLGDKVNFPRLTDDWRDPVNGARIEDPATGTWYTHEDYFNQVLVADPNIPTDGVYNGDIVIDARGDKFYWNASTNTKLVGSLPASLPPNTQDYIWFDPTNDVLRVNGQVRVNGTLTFTGQGGDRTINYSGRAALLVYGNITINTDILTCNNGNPADTANSFPVNNILGLMTATNMLVGATAQCDIMGAFYAQNTIQAAKQTDVMGTFVANYFDMGSQVPSIFQVPSLPENLPLGMIGNYPIMTLGQVSWRELGI
jgi:hypothetical protein